MLVLQVESMHDVRCSLEILEHSVHLPQCHPTPFFGFVYQQYIPHLHPVYL